MSLKGDSDVEEYRRRLTPSERLFTRSPFSTVTLVARIKGEVPESALRVAVSKVQQRHPNLRVRIVEDAAGDPWFTSDGAGEIPVEVVPRNSADDWVGIVREASQLPHQFDARPAIRFILVYSPGISELIILCHHIICDGLSLAYLARDLMVHLGDPTREVEVLPDPVPVERETIPKDLSLNAVVRFAINRMNRRWEGEKVVFDQEDYLSLNEAYWARYSHQLLPVELSEPQTSTLVDRCRSEGVTVTSALAAAFVGAQTVVQGEKPYHSSVIIAASLRDRLRIAAGEAMGFYAWGVRLKHKHDGGRAFWENARKFHQKVRPLYTNRKVFGDALGWSYLDPTILEAINFKKVGGLVPEHLPRYEKLSGFSRRGDVVLSLLRREKMVSLDKIAIGTAVTNLTRLDFPRRYGALELDRLIMKPGGAFPVVTFNLVVGAVTCAGKLSLVLEWAEDNVSTEAMREISAQALEFLQVG
jgi:hypothetical protein